MGFQARRHHLQLHRLAPWRGGQRLRGLSGCRFQCRAARGGRSLPGFAGLWSFLHAPRAAPCGRHVVSPAGGGLPLFRHPWRNGPFHGQRRHGLFQHRPVLEPLGREPRVQPFLFDAEGRGLFVGMQLFPRSQTGGNILIFGLRADWRTGRYAAGRASAQRARGHYGRHGRSVCRLPGRTSGHDAPHRPPGTRGRSLHALLCQLIPHRPRHRLHAERLSLVPYDERHEAAGQVAHAALHRPHASRCGICHGVSLWWRHQLHQHAELFPFHRLRAHAWRHRVYGRGAPHPWLGRYRPHHLRPPVRHAHPPHRPAPLACGLSHAGQP